MFDIKFLRENPEKVKENIKKKHKNDRLKLVDLALEKDKKWRELKGDVDNIRSSRNKISKQIADAKKAGKDTKKLLKEAGEIPSKIESLEKKMYSLEEELNEILSKIPNMMHSSVAIGKDDSENVTMRKIGKPREFGFEVKNHSEIAESLNVADFDASAKTSGNGFYYLQGDLALLNQALIRFAIDKLVSKGFTYVETPLMLRSGVMNNVTSLDDMKNQIYKIDEEDLYLIGTSEHSMIGRYVDTILTEKQLPMKFASYSMCFRKEIGSHGIDEKGLYRSHQFNKVEMVVICKPEDSMKFYDEIQAVTVEIFKDLEIPIRILGICSGDLGDLKHVQVDIEAWSPRKKTYFEVGSCSNLTDAQARKLKIRADNGNGEKYVPHTLNNTAIATSRAMVAILENYQQKDGSVEIPKVLLPYMHGKKVIGKK
ncbi:serine--tRNA ligase [Candidatus Pacearchaeota archaeon]|nr:serine--tRNA ligase [Candidatus Pacearchaeota archaeon]